MPPQPEELEEFLSRYRRTFHSQVQKDTWSGPTRRPPRAAQRQRLTRRVPEAVFKLTSKLKQHDSIKKAAAYIAREGELGLETETGDTLNNKDAINRYLGEWHSAQTGIRRRNQLDAVHLTLSSPKGSAQEQVISAARHFCREQFRYHRWVLVRHDDTDYPHVHVILENRNNQRRSRRWRKQDLLDLRLAWAQHERSVGIEVNATLRAQRGAYNKGVSQARFHSQRRTGASSRPPLGDRASNHPEWLKRQIVTSEQAIKDQNQDAARVSPATRKVAREEAFSLEKDIKTRLAEHIAAVSSGPLPGFLKDRLAGHR